MMYKLIPAGWALIAAASIAAFLSNFFRPRKESDGIRATPTQEVPTRQPQARRS